MIPIEYLWYIIGAVSVPAFIMIYLKALRRNREDKARVALRRKRFERTMKSPARTPGKSESSNRVTSEGARDSLKRTKTPAPMPQPASDRIESTVNPVDDTKEGHWLSGVKLPTKREQPASERIASAVEDPESTGHWLEHVKPKRKHWLDNLRR